MPHHRHLLSQSRFTRLLSAFQTSELTTTSPFALLFRIPAATRYYKMVPATDVLPAPDLPRISENKDTVAQHQPKRNRSQLSCTHCRQAKLKCDRNQPCSQCTKKGRGSLCTFPAPAARRKPTVSMQNRLKHLESLVKDVMTSQTPAGHPTPPSDESRATTVGNVNSGSSSSAKLTPDLDPSHGMQSSQEVVSQEEPAHSSGQVLLGENQTTYVGATHWAAILDDVYFYFLKNMPFY